MINDFDTKSAKLPPPVQALILSDFQRIISLEIRDQYKLSPQQGSMLNNLMVGLYVGDETLESFTQAIQQRLGISPQSANAVARDMLGRKLLAAADYYSGVEQAISKLGGKPEDYQKDVVLLKKAVQEEKAGTYNHDDYLYRNEPQPVRSSEVHNTSEELLQTDHTELTSDEREAALKDLFENNLELILETEAGESLDEINEALIVALGENQTLAGELEKIMLTSKTPLGEKSIILDGREVPPLATNWLKDFFTVMGTNVSDSLSIIHYFIESHNVKVLSDKQQVWLRHFLTLYFTLKNFPHSVAGMPVDQWQILPTTSSEDKISVVNKVTSPTPLVEQTINQAYQPTSARPARTSSSVRRASTHDISPVKKPIQPLPKKDTPSSVVVSPTPSPELLNLKNMLLEYPPNSLERQAIEEEIKKMERV